MNDQQASRTILSRNEWRDALRQGFEQAAVVGCRELFISDPNFSDWPLGERAVVDSLTRWAYGHRRLTVLAGHFDEVLRRHSRWSPGGAPGRM